ncbi:hypothetical protein M408DRAFT_28405 [Serendipita vermifera MAFF 305830]|uniref:Uncharacterized protein n=1 Tax=Serendipita vermifera MAFF 305830 TaxID=933852 RepID=A0A0C3AUA8_SERVB|nr:hypothetical protein M408DRAFT_28405 [Serendipita vermifera MAFF 305830]
MSITPSPCWSKPSRSGRAHWDDYQSLRSSRSAEATAPTSNNQTILNAFVHPSYFKLPILSRLPNLELRDKEHEFAGRAATSSVDSGIHPCGLFTATNAEKLCVEASHPEIFSNVEFFELLYGADNDVPSKSANTNSPLRYKNHCVTLERVIANKHPLDEAKRVLTSISYESSADKPPTSSTRTLSCNNRKGVAFVNALRFLDDGKRSVEPVVVGEAYEMGSPRSRIWQANHLARVAGYASHKRVQTGIEAQLNSMQFTKLTGDSYKRVNLAHEWFRSSYEYNRTLEVVFLSAFGNSLWEAAIQQQCNETYYFYIHNHHSYGTCMPPRLDLRPVQIYDRIVRFEQYLVPMHGWSGEIEDEDLVLIRGPFESNDSPLRKQLHLGQYMHNEDPRHHILFAKSPETGGLERWRTRNLTEDGSLFRYSRRDIEPSLVEYDEIDHIELFRTSHCRRYFPRLRPNIYPTRR